MFNQEDNNQNNHYYSQEDNYEENNSDENSVGSQKTHYYSPEVEDDEQNIDFHSDYLDSSYDSRNHDGEYFDEPSYEQSEQTEQADEDEEIQFLKDIEAENPGVFDTPYFPEYGKDNPEDLEYFKEETESFDDESEYFDEDSQSSDENSEYFDVPTEYFDEDSQSSKEENEYFDEPRRTSFLDEVVAEDPTVFTYEDEDSEDNSRNSTEEPFEQDYRETYDDTQEYVEDIGGFEEQSEETLEEKREETQKLLEETQVSAKSFVQPYTANEDTVAEGDQLEDQQNTAKEDIRRKYMLENTWAANTAKIMVLGIGGGGNNAVNRMIDMGVTTAHFVAINTDSQALMLSHCNMEDRYQIGKEETKGLGAGANPEVGERAAEESRELIEDLVKDVDLLFITAGMGGGTGSGAAPVVAKIAKEKGCLTVAVVTKPFFFEGATRIKNAEKAIANLKKYVDTIIIIPNDKLMEALRPDTPIVEAFKYADDTLRQGICGIADLIATPSLINLDFADVRTILKNRGLAHMGVGRAKGENRIIEAVKEAVSSPLLETTIEGAKGVILNVTGGKDLTLSQVVEAANNVRDIVDPSANVIFGMHIKENLQEEVIITIIATGFDTQADAAVNDDNAKAYNSLFTQKRQTAEDASAYSVPRSEPDSFVAPDKQWQRAAVDESQFSGMKQSQQPQQMQQSPQSQQMQQSQQIRSQSQQGPYTPHVPTAERVNAPEQNAEDYREEKKGLPSFVTKLLGGRKKNQ